MSLIKCPECGCEISDKSSTCVNCGFPIQQEIANVKVCPECGSTVDNATDICTYCGYDLKFSDGKDKTKKNVRIFIFALLLVLSLIFFIFAFCQTHNKKYSFYKYHYNECMDGYLESEYNKYNSSNWGYVYDFISEEYLDMAKDDMTKIIFYIIKAILFYILSVLSLTIGIIVLLRKRSKK